MIFFFRKATIFFNNINSCFGSNHFSNPLNRPLIPNSGLSNAKDGIWNLRLLLFESDTGGSLRLVAGLRLVGMCPLPCMSAIVFTAAASAYYSKPFGLSPPSAAPAPNGGFRQRCERHSPHSRRHRPRASHTIFRNYTNIRPIFY